MAASPDITPPPADPRDDHFPETATVEERLLSLQAMGLGCHALLRDLVARLTSYCDLLELELEDRPAGALYLRDSRTALQRCERLLALQQGMLARDLDTPEVFDFKALLRGVASRLKRIAFGDLQISDETLGDAGAPVRGKLPAMHQALHDLCHLVAPTANARGPRVRLRLVARQMDAEALRRRKSALPPGDYFELLASGDDRDPSGDPWISLHEQLCLLPDFHATEALLYLQGVMTDHGGDCFVPKDDASCRQVLLLLPVCQPKGNMYGESNLADSAPPRGQAEETILLVDDEGIIWDVVIDMLQGLGYTVVLAADGRECVEIYRENPGKISLVLLDMVMPEMNGHDAFFALKAIDPKVRVLLQSGYVAEEDAREVLEGGAAGFMRKPYRLAELARRIRAILDARK